MKTIMLVSRENWNENAVNMHFVENWNIDFLNEIFQTQTYKRTDGRFVVEITQNVVFHYLYKWTW